MTSVPHVATASGGYPGIHNTKRLNQARPSAMSPRLLRAAPKVPVMAASRRTCLTVVANAASQGDAIPPPIVFNTVLATAEKKAAQDLSTTLVLGFSAGALIGIGALLMSCVGASSPALASANPGLCNFLKGAVGLPAGLTLVINAVMHDFWTLPAGELQTAHETQNFVKNLGIVAGLLVVSGLGAGRWSLDSRR